MIAIVDLLTPFKECGEALSSEKDVTISLIVPYFNNLREHLSTNTQDLPIIKQMKSKMLQKLNSRYNDNQIRNLTICTLLDPRHKNAVKDKFDLL